MQLCQQRTYSRAAFAPARARAGRVARRCLVVKADAATTTKRPLRVMIAGAPAAGKGTQCEKIVEKFNLVHISVGDLLREQVQQGTPAGKKAKDFMDQGVLVPDEVVVEMVKSRLAGDDVQQRGWLLDGYPRSASQAEAIEAEGIRPDIFLLIDVPAELLVERVVGRRMDPQTGAIYHLKYKPPPAEIMDRLVQRSDDTEEKCKTRLETHFKNVDSVIGYYRDCLCEIEGDHSMEAVASAISAALDQAYAKIGDPLEDFCASNPEQPECLVYDD
ncbi:hypothetical protein OEZ85_013152 [Tetradesmus obliquus]|uniref:adenylate kinase n=1 Tax=Tetradesmus obliquus TaxID=3088 RepID=A0ABY8U4T0_TETOB|nr:hypothetical protein OEZ85_013152 [Tetradesmus obliquus]